MDSRVSDLRRDLKRLADPQKIAVYQRFFKTGKGDYGEGDVFIGLTVPKSRSIAVKYKDLSHIEISELLSSKIHEERLIALFILVNKFKKGSEPVKKEIVEYYLDNTKHINNWDLVDLSADKILGEFLLDKDKKILLKLARSKNLWERRIAIISTFAFIKRLDPEWTFKIAEVLIPDKHDLIQKATGWMIREVGKRCSIQVEEEFLAHHYKQMGRTALRYSIEHFPEVIRKKYLAGTV